MLPSARPECLRERDRERERERRGRQRDRERERLRDILAQVPFIGTSSGLVPGVSSKQGLTAYIPVTFHISQLHYMHLRTHTSTLIMLDNDGRR